MSSDKVYIGKIADYNVHALPSQPELVSAELDGHRTPRSDCWYVVGWRLISQPQNLLILSTSTKVRKPVCGMAGRWRFFMMRCHS
jgi:hypothetical protein